MSIRLLAGMFFMLLAGCMESDRDFFAASEKVEMPVSGTWTKVSGRFLTFTEEARIGDPIVIEKTGPASYLARGNGEVQMSFVPLEGTGHVIVIVERKLEHSPDDVFYYLMRMAGEDMFVISLGCPADRIAGLEKGKYVCRVNSRAALLAVAEEHLSDPRNLGASAPGALYRRTAP
ncbi:MAG: hypothetical protein KDD90_08020 [Sphingomonadaceae bacterium]|jgi:hypothetical protein|nr:hypothetical protein [Sphingomonadaceae bacterium]